MKTIFYLTFAACLLTGVLACSLKDIFKVKEELPTLSQDGRKAMGFLLNGEVWVPKGRTGQSQNYQFDVDPDFDSLGVFNISVYRFPNFGDGTRNGYQDFAIGARTKATGIYQIGKATPGWVVFFDWDSKCEYSNFRASDTLTQADGYLEITRYDLEKGVFQGEFEVTLWKPGCDTMRITEGRFDWKF
ncbi:MAG TPA: hypothetical protein PKE68_12610 [Saprospiraceae bacterium]|nr:hypothetical protein [Saprospiraceae bacterium]